MVLNSTRGKRERIGRILRMHANKREELKEVLRRQHLRGGRACATRAPATRCATRSSPIILEQMMFPEPVISIAIEPKTKADLDKLGVGLQKLAYEDPSFRTLHERRDGADDHRRHGRAAPRDHRRPPEARVQGRAQRRQAPGRVPRDDRASGVESVEAKLRPSRRAATASTATCASTSSRGERGAGYVFENDVVGGVIPKEFIPRDRKGHQEAMERGVLAGYPSSTCKATLYDGSYHEVDSSAQAFEVAGSMAFQEAAQAPGLQLLEPIMKVEVTVPRAVHGRRHRRPQLASRQDPRYGPARQHANHRRRGSTAR